MPDLTVDLHGIHRVALVAAARLHLEGTLFALHQFHRLRKDALEIVLVHLDGTAYAVHAEHLAHAAQSLLHVVGAGHVYAAVGQPHMPVRVPDGLLDPLHQHAHEIRAVQPF